LTPDWVKEPTQKFAQHPGDTGGPRGRGPGDRDRRGPPRRRQGPPSGGGGGPPRPDGGDHQGRSRPDRGRPGKGSSYRQPGPPPIAPAPVEVVFAPEEKGFAAMVAAMKQSGRAYALFDLARLILSKPERHVVRLSRRPGAEGTPPPSLVYVAASESAFVDRAEALRHLFARHRNLISRELKTPIDPPKGNFTFVNRCGVTGAWLGPPNYHEYQARLVRHHQSHVRHLPFEQFKARIETIRDPEAVQAWLNAMSMRTEFACRCCEPAAPAPAPAAPESATPAAATESPAPPATPDPAEPVAGTADDGGEADAVAETPAAEATAEAASEPAESAAAPETGGVVFATLRELEQHIEAQHLDQFVTVLPEVTLTGTGARQSVQRGIAAAVRIAWESERRFPLKTVNLLRPRLQREGFYFFKHPSGVTYITRTRPQRFTAGQDLSDQVQRIIAGVRSPHGCTHKQLLDRFLPAAPTPPADPPATTTAGSDTAEKKPAPAESDAVKKPAAPAKTAAVPPAVIQEIETRLAGDLHWLIDEGFVVEFADGRLWAMDEKKLPPPEPPKAKPPAKESPAAPAETAARPAPASEGAAAKETPAAKEGAETAAPATEQPAPATEPTAPATPSNE